MKGDRYKEEEEEEEEGKVLGERVMVILTRWWCGFIFNLISGSVVLNERGRRMVTAAHTVHCQSRTSEIIGAKLEAPSWTGKLLLPQQV